ncbi:MULTISPECIES: hypothetical protein [Actinosynnema]|uniref:hypothetical protein n=1 Tax=Actinosynnema TaxID=40566 RepID=UPI0020A5D3E9|nr:hypothetical protein [Actinosynnema pretiosum]MCP2099721.1 hypothetical protein [Actinosynnema pretiosum]
MSDAATVEFPARPARVHSPQRPDPTPLRLWRGFSGSLAAGLVLLLVVELVVQFWASDHAVPGPGAGVVTGHAVAAALAVAGQLVADRARGWTSAALATAVVLVTALALWFLWWA